MVAIYRVSGQATRSNLDNYPSGAEKTRFACGFAAPRNASVPRATTALPRPAKNPRTTRPATRFLQARTRCAPAPCGSERSEAEGAARARRRAVYSACT